MMEGWARSWPGRVLEPAAPLVQPEGFNSRRCLVLYAVGNGGRGHGCGPTDSGITRASGVRLWNGTT